MRKTYRTKTEVKKARRCGQSVYKVKGGYRLSTKRKVKKRLKRRR